MEKPYYKSQLRLQKRKSSINSHIYKYTHGSSVILIQIIIENNLNKLVITGWQINPSRFYDLEEITNMYKLNIRRILLQYPTSTIVMIKSNNLLRTIDRALLQCGFVLQYTKELGYHFIR